MLDRLRIFPFFFSSPLAQFIDFYTTRILKYFLIVETYTAHNSKVKLPKSHYCSVRKNMTLNVCITKLVFHAHISRVLHCLYIQHFQRQLHIIPPSITYYYFLLCQSLIDLPFVAIRINNTLLQHAITVLLLQNTMSLAFCCVIFNNVYIYRY